MTVEELCANYPRLYHMAEASAWPSIQEHGLLSTSALLDLYRVPEPVRREIESTRRPDFVSVAHPNLGISWIRDQRPLSDEGLLNCLTDMSPREWYTLLNGKVFFWLNEVRLIKLLGTYRHRDNVVLVLDTGKVMARYAGQTMLSPINSGFTRRFPQPRGSATFRTIADYPFAQWVKKRGVKDAIAECTVTDKVEGIRDALLELRQHPRSRSPVGSTD